VGYLAEIVSTKIKKIKGAPGDSIVANVKGVGDSGHQAEVFSVPGIYGRPTKGTFGVELTVFGMKIIVGTHNYKLRKALDRGETFVYSMLDDGTIKASAYLDKEGNFVLNDGADYAVKYSELDTILQKIATDVNAELAKIKLAITALGGTYKAVPIVVDSSGAKVDKVRI